LIETLRIENVAIVEQAELEFGPGLNVLTGETGAGKSIVLGALGLLAGGRASSGMLRAGCDAAAVEAIFRTQSLPELEDDLVQRELGAEEHELIVSRSVSRSGRSRARVGGNRVPVGVLGDLFQGRLEISSQHDSQALLRPETHGWLLDRLGGLLDRRAAVSDGHRRLGALQAELDRLREEARDRERQRDFLAFQVEEIDEAALDPEEVGELRALHDRLAHAGRLREEGAAALALLAGDPLRDEATGASDLLGEAARVLEGVAKVDAVLGGQAERLAELQSEARELSYELERHLDGIEADPARQATVDERLHRIEQLQRKYGADVAEVLRFRDEAAKQLAHLEGAEEREAEIRREREACREELGRDAAALTAGRRKAARKLGRAVEAQLRELGMPGARFTVALEASRPPEGLPCGPTGSEQPEFRFSANEGEEPRPLHQVASGGELSRAFLAVKSALREHGAGMVLVFDEVDAGVGGRAADRVGRVLAELAGHHQILCITHLPQIAAFAGTHFRVEKSTRGGRTHAQITRIDGDERVAEIARMAGGEKVGEATLRHAREMLSSRGGDASA